MPDPAEDYLAELQKRPAARDGYSFGDLPADKFPFRIVLEDSKTRLIVHTIVVDGPGVVAVPALGHLVSPGAFARAIITFADGTRVVEPPYGAFPGHA